MRTDWPAYVAAEANRIAADEEAFERLVDLFKQAHGRAPSSDYEAYKWGAKMEDAALTAMGFEGRAGFEYNYDLCLMVEYGPRAIASLGDPYHVERGSGPAPDSPMSRRRSTGH
jgi:hypothetical protein